MNHSTTLHPALSGFLATVFVLLSGIAACSPPTPEPVAPPATAAPGPRNFTGAGSLAGTRQTLNMGPDRRAEAFRLSGALMLTGEQRLGLGFRAEVIGLADNQTGLQGRSVWTDERGDQVFSTLSSATTGPGSVIQGRLIGGTGRFAGVSGDYRFTWSPLVVSEDGGVSGRLLDLKGSALLALPPSPPGTAAGAGPAAAGARP